MTPSFASARAAGRGAALLGAMALALSCSRDPGAGPAPTLGSAIPPAPSGGASGAATVERSASDDEVRPVYPVTADPPDPLAARLCEALHALPVKRKAACCGGAPGFHFAGECARTLSFALRSKAVTLGPEDVDRCVHAMERSLEGCDWVTPLSAPPPAACEGIVRGTLPAGARCRSSLECLEGLHCAGAGPTDAGRCAPPPARGACGGSVDALAASTRQTRFELTHPECAGHCERRVCTADVPSGGACERHGECGQGRRCAAGKCSDAPLPAAGEPCLGGLCAEGARCVKGRCAVPKAEGEPCQADAECRGACVVPRGKASGTCAMKCSAR